MGTNFPTEIEKLKKESKYNNKIKQNIVNKNHFEFLYIIGRGGFGRVWKVKLKTTNDYFACKVMSKSKIISRHSQDNIVSEKKILSKIHHPFIVNMYFSFQDFENLYLLMDFLSGGDLRYHISHKKPCVFNEIQTKFFISNIIIALEYIHNQKIIHRDIKPENLVMDLNGYIRLTDFGIAIINNKDNSKESSGTAGYMAPEVMLQQGHSYPADFFALGVIGYEFMIGHRPYYGRNRKQVKDFILSYQAKIKFNNKKKGWSENSRDFINRLLQRRPVKRLGYNGIKELKNHLWLKDINWELLRKKKVRAPYIPKEGKDYFDKQYCQEEKTKDNYKNTINISEYQHLFENYTYINLNYISRLNKKTENNISNDIEYNSMRQLSFSDTLGKGKSFSSSKNLNFSNINSTLKINKNFFSANRLSKSIKNNINNNKDNTNSSSSKSRPFMYKSTNQLNQYYNIGLSKDKEKEKDIHQNEKKIDEKKETNNNNNKKNTKNKKLTKRCFSSENIMQDKKLNLKEIHKLIERSILNSNIFSGYSSKKSQGLISSKSFKSKSNLSKSRTNKILPNYPKSSFVERDKEKEKDKDKENIFNSTTKEKTTKERTTDNKDKKSIQKINKKPKSNKTNNNKLTVVKKDDLKFATNDNLTKNKNIIKNNTKELHIDNQILYKEKNYCTKITKNKIKQVKKTTINNDNKSNNNENDYHIKVVHKKIYNMRNKKSITQKKQLINHNSVNNNNSLNKNNSMNKNKNNKYMTINSLSQKRYYKSSKNFSGLKKTKKTFGHKSNKLFNSQGFNEFRKKKMNNINDVKRSQKSFSTESLIKENKEKKNKMNNDVNNGNGKITVLKFDDYFRNTGLDKESKKNNYYILDKFVSI